MWNGKRKCLDKKMCNTFQEYFEINKHKSSTRNNGIMVKRPKVKLHGQEFARQAFWFSASKIYNELPKQIGAEKDCKIFKNMLDSNFM